MVKWINEGTNTEHNSPPLKYIPTEEQAQLNGSHERDDTTAKQDAYQMANGGPKVAAMFYMDDSAFTGSKVEGLRTSLERSS